jgi:hypothetical protein
MVRKLQMLGVGIFMVIMSFNRMRWECFLEKNNGKEGVF